MKHTWNEQGELTWVYHVDNMVNHGIVPGRYGRLV